MKPIFIVGPHRSGTTLVYNIVARHPDAGYFNQVDRRLRSAPRLAHLVTRILGRDEPHEVQRLWDRFMSGADDGLGAADATDEQRRWLHARIGAVLRLRGASRFVAKYPRLSLRLRWLDALFPDARFVHVVRDWRAVVASTVVRKVRRAGARDVWFGVRIPGWQAMKSLPHDLAATRQYLAVGRTLAEEGTRFGERLVRLHYRELCQRPVETVRALFQKLELRWPEGHEKRLPAITLRNDKWRDTIPEARAAELRQEDPAFLAPLEDPA